MAIVLIFVLSLMLASPSVAQTDHQIVDVGWLGKRSALQKKLDEAAISGYQVVRGFERLVILRKGLVNERDVYTVVGRGDAGQLEREMNAAGASGFRLVPEAVLSSHLLAVMHKRAGIPDARIAFKLLSFTANYDLQDMGRRRAVSGGFEADEIDTRLSEMAVAGFRVVALLTRTLNERAVPVPIGRLRALTPEKQEVRQELIVFFEKDPSRREVTTVREAARRYHLITGESASDFEEQLNRAASAGYGLLAVAEHGFPAPVAVVERLAPASPRPTYRVLAPRTVSGLQDELRQAARSGWVPHPRAVVDPSGGRHDMNEVLLVLQRQHAASAGDVLVLSTVRTSTLAKELDEAAAAGFELTAGGRARGEVVLVLRR